MAIPNIQGLWKQFSLADILQQTQQQAETMQNLERGQVELEAMKANAARQQRLQEILGGAAQGTTGQAPESTQANIIKQLQSEGYTKEAQAMTGQMMEQFRAIGDQDKYAAAEFWNKNMAPVTGQQIEYSEPDDYTEPKEVVGPDGKPVLIQRNKRTNEWEIIEGFKPRPKSGQIIRTNPDGSVEIIEGEIGENGAWGALTKPVRNQVQQDLINMQDEYERAMSTAKTFRPEFLEIGTKIENEAKMLGEKLNLYKPEGQSKRDLEQYVDFKRNAIEDINMYIKRITGAQMSEKEADRIRMAKPDPGEGIFSGDSPTQFQSKMQSTVRSLRLSMARRNYLLKEGITDSQLKNALKEDKPPISLNRMSDIIKNDAEAIYNELKKQNPDADDADLSRQAFEKAFAQYGA